MLPLPPMRWPNRKRNPGIGQLDKTIKLDQTQTLPCIKATQKKLIFFFLPVAEGTGKTYSRNQGQESGEQDMHLVSDMRPQHPPPRHSAALDLDHAGIWTQKRERKKKKELHYGWMGKMQNKVEIDSLVGIVRHCAPYSNIAPTTAAANDA